MVALALCWQPNASYEHYGNKTALSWDLYQVITWFRLHQNVRLARRASQQHVVWSEWHTGAVDTHGAFVLFEAGVELQDTVCDDDTLWKLVLLQRHVNKHLWLGKATGAGPILEQDN